MKRRTFLKGSLLASLARLVPISVLEKAIALHNVKITVVQNDGVGKASMSIDGADDVEVESLSITFRHEPSPIREVGNRVISWRRE